MFGRKLEIGEGQKYDMSKVSTEDVNQEEVAKKNLRLIDIFKAFDTNKDGKLNSTEMANALQAFDTLDTNNDNKLSKSELEEAAKKFNENKQLTGNEQVSAKDLKKFIKNLFAATQTDPTTETQKEFEKYQKQLRLEALDKQAQDAGWEWSPDGAYWDKKNNKYYLPNADGTKFEEVHWSDKEQKFKVMSAEELAELNAALEQQKAQQEAPAEEKNKTYSYVVQPDETFTQVVTKALKAQGIENPTDEQIEEAKEQFKKDNPDAVKTTSSGYEYLLVGAEVNLRGEVESAMSSKDAEIAWAKAHPKLVSDSWVQDHTDVKLEGRNDKAQGNGDLTAEEKAKGDEAAKEAGYRTTNCDGVYYDEANKQHYKYNPATGELEKFDATCVNKNGSYFLEVKDKNGNYTSKYYDKYGNEITKEEYDKIKDAPPEEQAVAEEQPAAATTEEQRAENVEAMADSITPNFDAIDGDEANKEKIEQLKANKDLFINANNALASMVDAVENESDSVTKFGPNKEGYEYCSIKDGPTILIERDEEGNITDIYIDMSDSNGESMQTLVHYSKNSVGFKRDGGDTNIVHTDAFDFEKIKALAERIFGKKPSKAE